MWTYLGPTRWILLHVLGWLASVAGLLVALDVVPVSTAEPARYAAWYWRSGRRAGSAGLVLLVGLTAEAAVGVSDAARMPTLRPVLAGLVGAVALGWIAVAAASVRASTSPVWRARRQILAALRPPPSRLDLLDVLWLGRPTGGLDAVRLLVGGFATGAVLAGALGATTGVAVAPTPPTLALASVAGLVTWLGVRGLVRRG